MTTVLFTCAGQRVDIVRAFAAAGATTVAGDVDPLAPALYHADGQVLLPAVADPDYIPALAQAVTAHGVDLLLPLTNLDHCVLAANREALAALLLLPDLEVVERTVDKYLAHLFFLDQGIGSPPTWLPDDLPDELPFPVLVKARRWSGSRGISRAEDRDDLEVALRRASLPSVVQRVCRGEEFSIDVFCDLDGRCLNAIPRTMIESKGGESIKGMTIRDDELIELGRSVAEAFPLRGPATIQCFRTLEGGLEVTDVNARFGGAFPLPLAAGGRYPELALALARGEHPAPRVGDFRAGIVMTRFPSEVCLAAENGAFTPVGEPARTADAARS